MSLGTRTVLNDRAMFTGRTFGSLAVTIAFGLGIMTIASAWASDESERPGRGPLSPLEAQASFRVDPGLRVELVAAEPHVTSPVAIAFHQRGRLWVVEMRDYPNGPAPGEPPEGRLRLLEDRDGDGRFEHASTFAEGLLYANGVLPWRDGAIVTAAPQILWLRDLDGDGRADAREVLYDGFDEGNPQHLVSQPTLGLDGWIYVANGHGGGSIRPGDDPDAEPIELGARDFRFDPVHGRAEVVAGMGQFGLTFDDWGHRFVCSNRNHLTPIIFEERYAGRNPYLAVPPPVRDDQSPGATAAVYPLTRQFTTSTQHQGSFTACSGITIYRGGLLPSRYRGSAFVCEPTGSLVHQDVLIPQGAGFVGRPAREGVEFFASLDERSRPVELAHGPDGALYVVDMYRAVIEHPEWIPPELLARVDLLEGKERGRIWRIVPDQPTDDHSKDLYDQSRLTGATTKDLVGLLAHPDGWWRSTAQRLLLQRQDPKALEPLRNLATSSTSPQGRVHAAWLLDHADALDESTILSLLNDDHPRLREQGALLAERRLADAPALAEAVADLDDDPDARVRYQAALSLGFWDDDRILEALATIAERDADDRWTRLAVASAVPERAGALIRTLLEPPHDLTAQIDPDRLTLLRELATLVGSRRDLEESAVVLRALLAIGPSNGLEATPWQLAGLVGFTEGLDRRRTRLSDFLDRLPDGVARRTDALLASAAEMAEETGGDLSTRLDAITLLTHADWDVAASTLSGLLRRAPEVEIRSAAARALADRNEPEVADALLDAWPTLTPEVRRLVAQALVARTDRASKLLDAIVDGRLTARDLNADQARRLLNHRDDGVRDRARNLLASRMPADRAEVLERYRDALTMPGDVDRGRAVFRRACTTCHRIEGVGVDVGPNVSDNWNKSKESLLTNILHPNAASDAEYLTYTLSTVDGQILNGLIASETASSLTIRRAEGETSTVLKADVDEIRADGTSLMPEGLEQDIDVQQMADLLEYLKLWRYEGESIGGDQQER